MILSDLSILKAIESGDIEIAPYDRERLGPNSYDVTLGRNLLTYSNPVDEVGPNSRFNILQAGSLDASREHNTRQHVIGPQGFWLYPETLYLGVINEFVRTSSRYVPMIDGTSSAGRLGISVHATAGRGDAGYAGHFTLEISVIQPIRVYAGMPIGQIWWLKVDGDVARPYGARASSNYHSPVREENPMPKPSAMWRKLKAGK